MKNATYEFSNGKILPLIFKLTIPAVLAQLVTFLYNVVDRMYVSNIQGISTEALAALGIILPISIIVQAFANLIGLGGSPVASIELGQGNTKKAKKIFNVSFMSLLIVGLISTIILLLFSKQIITLFGCPSNSIEYANQYLQIYAIGSVFIILVQGLNPFISAEGKPLIAMGTTLLGAVLNIILDPIFIFTFNMGISGASLATIISQFVSFIWVMSFFLLNSTYFKFALKEMKLKISIIKSIIFLGLSSFIMTFTESLIQIVFNNCLTSSTGGTNSSYTAALTIMLSALQLISLPLNGLGYGIAPFISYNYGKGDAYRIKKAIKYTYIIALIFSIVVYIISMLFPEIYAYLFNANEEVKNLITQYCPLFLMGTIMFSIQMTLQNINVALGQGKTATILAITRKVILLIPLCYILTSLMGFKGVYLSEGVADLIAGTITGIVIFTTFPKVINHREKEVKYLK